MVSRWVQRLLVIPDLVSDEGAESVGNPCRDRGTAKKMLEGRANSTFFSFPVWRAHDGDVPA
jgi:hypothetical protein